MPEGGDEDLQAYACNGDACRSSCALDADCAAGSICSKAGECINAGVCDGDHTIATADGKG